MSNTRSSLVPFKEADFLLALFVDTCSPAVGSVERVERQEVRRDVEMVGLGVMNDVCITVPVAGMFELMISLLQLKSSTSLVLTWSSSTLWR